MNKNYLCPFYSEEEEEDQKNAIKKDPRVTPKGTYAYTCKYTREVVDQLVPTKYSHLPIVLFSDGKFFIFISQYSYFTRDIFDRKKINIQSFFKTSSFQVN